MRGRTLIVLAALALLQGAWLLWSATRGEAPAAAGRLVQLDRERIDAIQVQRRGGAPVELARRGESWAIVRPLDEPADGDAVESILSAAEFLESWRLAPDRVSAAQLGLDAPAVRLVLAQGGRRQELRLGAIEPAQRGVYLETAGARHVVPRSFLEAVDHGLDELRDRGLVHLPREKVTRLVRSGESPLELERDGAGEWWQRHAGQRLPVSREGVDRLIAGLLALRATRFLPVLPPGPMLELRVEAGEGGPAALRLGGTCPAQAAEALVAVRRSRGWVAACVDGDDLASLRAPAESLLDLALTRAEEPELSRVRIGAGRASLELRREAGLWQLPGGAPADREEVRAWLEALRGLRGTLRASPAEAAGEGILELQRESGGVEHLAFGRGPRGAGLVVQRRGMSGAVLLVEAEPQTLLPTDPLRFRSRQLWRFQAEEVRRVRLEGEGGALELSRRDEGWSVLRPAGAALDADRLQALLERLARLRAVQFVDDRLTAGRPQRSFRLELDPEPLAGSEAPRRLGLDLWRAPGAGACRGRVAGAPPFALEETDCQLLSAGLLRVP